MSRKLLGLNYITTMCRSIYEIFNRKTNHRYFSSFLIHLAMQRVIFFKIKTDLTGQ